MLAKMGLTSSELPVLKSVAALARAQMLSLGRKEKKPVHRRMLLLQSLRNQPPTKKENRSQTKQQS
jgi:hypothetical protein